MALSDDHWIAEARRQLLANGAWRIPIAPAAAPAPQSSAALGSPACPACDGRPTLAVYARPEIAAGVPLRCCLRCYGFWAAGDALTAGVSSPSDEREALYARTFPSRCPSCSNAVHDRRRCRRCAADLPPYACPQCERPMDRFAQAGATLDACGACKGTWFDVGELAQVHSLDRPQSLAAGLVDEHAGPTNRALLLQALGVVSRVFLPFLPFP